MTETNQDRELYDGLIALAESRGIRCVEAHGLDTRRGVRFSRDGQDWIVFDKDLTAHEKARVIGFLLEHPPEDAAMDAGFFGNPSEARSHELVQTLCC